jgi:hypothetical protein
MGKKSCTDHSHTKVGPHEQKLATLTIVHLSRAQMGSESLCRGEVTLALHIFPAWPVVSLGLVVVHPLRAHLTPGGNRPPRPCCLRGRWPRFHLPPWPYGVRSVLRGAVRTPAVSDSWCPGLPTPRTHASR